MLFSEEIINAMKYGYKFEVQYGYLFESDFVFKNCIEDLYKLRLEYPKSDPMNYVSKIIMNSLYGRFGMDDDFVFTYIMDKNDYSKFEDINKNSIIDVISIDDNYLVQVKNPKVELDTTLDNASEVHNINIAIASAITAYSRIHMSQFKNNPNYTLLYTDTDSIYIDRPLPDSLVSNTELGKLKLERICDKAVFIAPKVYGLLDENGNLIVKIKGLTSESSKDITLDQLNDYIGSTDHSLELNQEKWYKSIGTGDISVLEQIYTLKVTGNKRKLIYSNDKLVDTSPFIINQNK